MNRLFAFPLLSLFVLGAACASAANSLKDAPSAFLRSHAENPVEWLPWGEAAFAKAKKENKPVYVAIGSSLSELSSAMNRQTFSNAQGAAVLNREFVCVLVDRDELPGIAALYQNFVSTKKQLTGWPLNLWLTPELKPIDGTTYLPPSEEWGKEGFLNATQRIVSAWSGDAAAQRQKADDAVAEVTSSDAPIETTALSTEALKAKLLAATKAHVERFDATHGGFGDVPKYVEPELLRVLVAQTDEAARNAASKTLAAIQASPLRDAKDGGYFRYSTDAEWKTPYFQKLALDQARISSAFCDFAESTHDKAYLAAARAPLDFVLAQLIRPDGLVATGDDSTSEEARKKGEPARRDENAVAATQGAVLAALARAAMATGEDRYLTAAKALASAIDKHLLSPHPSLHRLAGSAAEAGPSDYAYVVAGYAALAKAAKEPSYAKRAEALAAKASSLFLDAKSGRFYAFSEPLPEGVWQRVPSPLPAAGEGPSAEAEMLLALLELKSADASATDSLRTSLTKGLSAELDEAAGPINGGALLAVQRLVAAGK